MSPDGVHENEMPRFPRNPASDDEWPAGDPALASFAEDLRMVAGGPAPEPRPGLLAAMRQGPLVSTEPPAATGRKKMLVKTVLGGLAAKVALGAGVAAASVTAAGAAGVLPEPAHQVVASVVAATTPFSLPDPSDVTLQVVDDLDGTTTTTISTTTSVPDDGDGELTGGTGAVGGDTGSRTVNHGACVSAAARDKAESESGSHGKTVSSIARTDCGKEDKATTSTTGASSTTSSTTSTTLDDGQRSANSGPGNSGNGGNSGGGNRGNGGNGNSGSGSANSGRGSSGQN